MEVQNLLPDGGSHFCAGGSVVIGEKQGTARAVDHGRRPPLQEQAFTKFFRSARSRETAIPGAGLGLPVSKTIVEGHGGSISLESEPGVGTKATFTLPGS